MKELRGPFTLYRATNEFMSELNKNKQLRELHRNRSDIDCEPQKSINAINAMLENKWLLPAATVDCPISVFFEKTNSISKSWLDNPEVVVLNNLTFLSSTSVGDLAVDANNIPFVVANCTYVPLAWTDTGLIDSTSQVCGN